MRIVLAHFCAILLLQGCAGTAQQPVAGRTVTEAIQCFPDSWNRFDMVAFGECFATGAAFVNVTATWWKGRASIQKNHAYLLGTIDAADRDGVTLPRQSHGIFKATTLTFKSTELRSLRPDVQIARVSWQITGDARTPQPRNGLLMLVITSSGGHSQIAAVQNTEIARPIK